VHLLLATRQPAGAITPELRSDIDLRIALRTADRNESLEVVGTEGAASLPPGRALLSKLRARSITPFQTAHSGAAYREYQRSGNWAVPVPWFHLGRPLLGATPGRTMVENRTNTDLLVLVEALRKAAAHLAVEPQPRPWPPALP
jgi:S-DNA-T family DNA segregation ATPase FtsK/SpoIIIE